jgi:thiamine biosynthesis protein ThiI
MDPIMKLLALISGGIDSPVAAHLMRSRGHRVDCVHFDNRPFTDDKQYNKAIELVKLLHELHGGDMKLYVAPNGDAMIAIAERAPRRYGCVLCRRMMLRVASMIAHKYGYEGLVTGESLGQVASQTLENIRVEEGASSSPVIRPLIGLDKTEIMEIARETGTYDISISPGLCCTITPDTPATKAKSSEIEKAEKKCNVQNLASGIFEQIETCDLGDLRGCV